MIFFGIGFIGCTAWYFWPGNPSLVGPQKLSSPESKQAENESNRQTPSSSPNVTLKLVGRESPGVLLINNSNKVAQNIKWMVALWNLDDPKMKFDQDITNTSKYPQPLKIPVQIFDFIRPHSMGGPMNIFDTPLVSPFAKKGDRLIGSISVVCPDCERGHTFVVYIVFGQGGWYYEFLNETSGSVLIPKPANRDGIMHFYESMMGSIPESGRININDYG